MKDYYGSSIELTIRQYDISNLIDDKKIFFYFIKTNNYCKLVFRN
ncbi:MAG: hypothetical protein QG670_1619 [Thermoproteota archaeon]|nr:hypothetical protein [Thermoproteota archaeon]